MMGGDVSTEPTSDARISRRTHGTVYRRRGRWYLKYRLTDPKTGRRERRTEPAEGAVSKEHALLALDHRLLSIADGSFFQNADQALRFDDVADEFLRWARTERRGHHNYAVAIENARAHFAGKALSAMTTASLEAFRTRLVEQLMARRIGRRGSPALNEDERRLFLAAARATTNRRMTVLRRMFNRLVELDRLSEGQNPFKRGRLKPYSEAQNARIRYYSPEEISTILAAANEPFRSLVALALNTGLRRGELVSLRWDDWDEISSTLRVRFSKGGKPRSVPVNSAAAEILKRLKDGAKHSHLFVNKHGRRVTANWATMTWRRVCSRAGIPDARLHDCRHSFASHLVNRGVSLLMVQKLLGHSSPRVTERYSHVAKGALHDAAEVMANVFGEARSVDAGLHVGLPAGTHPNGPSQNLAR